MGPLANEERNIAENLGVSGWFFYHLAGGFALEKSAGVPWGITCWSVNCRQSVSVAGKRNFSL